MICELTQLLSIYSSLFMLMTQALISRVLVPGMSNFVNASVRRLLAPASGSALFRQLDHALSPSPASGFALRIQQWRRQNKLHRRTRQPR
jgi:hypothetical protein